MQGLLKCGLICFSNQLTKALQSIPWAVVLGVRGGTGSSCWWGLLGTLPPVSPEKASLLTPGSLFTKMYQSASCYFSFIIQLCLYINIFFYSSWVWEGYIVFEFHFKIVNKILQNIRCWWERKIIQPLWRIVFSSSKS